MQLWDVFHNARVEAEHSLTADAVRQALASGDLVQDDLVRPAGHTSWTRIGDSPEFSTLGLTPDRNPFASGPASFEPPSFDEELDTAESHFSQFEEVPEPDAPGDREPPRAPKPQQPIHDLEFQSDADFEIEVEVDDDPKPQPAPGHRREPIAGLPISSDDEYGGSEIPRYDHPIPDMDFEEYDPQDEDEEAAEFTFTRSSAERVEELDLAAMVDVAFQLVLFFLVTAQVVLFKTLEIPRPNEDKPPDAAVQARTKSIDELKDDYILVEVDAAGAIKIDRQPVAASRPVLIEKLRKTREDTQRKAMLLSADFATRHENAVLVFDVANEIDLRIAIAQPVSKK
jgi:biopolymer transport protein ExbD